MLEPLQSICDQLGFDLGLDKPWDPVSRPALVAWSFSTSDFSSMP